MDFPQKASSIAYAPITWFHSYDLSLTLMPSL